MWYNDTELYTSCTNMNFLVLLLNCSDKKRNNWGNMGEGCTGLLCSIFAIVHDSRIISKFKVKEKK